MANFSASTVSGCEPLTNVQFTDLSTGSPTNWSWNFGNGNTSSLQNPTATFSSAGTYTVQLTASNGSGSSNFSLTITVHPNPNANFSASSATAGCLPHSVTFQDNSTPAASIVSRLWTFGDGGQSSLASPQHTYGLAGTFPVSLKVTTNQGCEDVKQIPAFVEVYPLPIVSFTTSSLRQTCQPPLSVNFINNSTGSGTLTYSWDFGDGQTSTAENPGHTYNAYGSYDVTLTVTDNNACSKSLTLTDYVVIDSIQADFNYNTDSVCLGDSIKFTDISTGSLVSRWNFGDGTSDVGTEVYHTYQDSGWYTVRLIASISAAGCADTVYKDVYVEQVVADFLPSQRYLCNEGEVTYISSSTNADKLLWKYGLRCPTPQPSLECGKTTTDTVVRYYFSVTNDLERVYRDTLIAISTLGCRDTSVLDSSVIVNVVRGEPFLNQYQGCRPYTIDFSDVSSPFNPTKPTISPAPTMVRYTWYIDDTIYANLKDPPNLILTDTGVWDGFFVVENSEGCIDSALFKFRAGDSVKADFTVLWDTICAEQADTLISLSMDTTYITGYSWSARPAKVGVSQDKLKAFVQPEDTGYISVTHYVNHHGCGDTIRDDSAIYVNGPINEIGASLFNCIDSTKISFRSVTKGLYSWLWDFGDTNLPPDSVNLNPVVTYSKRGYYTVKMTGYNQDSSCVYEDEIVVSALPQKADLLTDSGGIQPNYINFGYEDTLRGCAPLTVNFTSYGSPGSMFGDWLFDTVSTFQVPNDSIQTRTYTESGFYQVRLVVFDTIAKCSDTAYTTIAVYNPVADFIGNPNRGCIPLNAQLIPQVQTLNNIVKYYWDVGGIIDSTEIFTRNFTSQVLYDAQLVVVDSFGCRDTVIKNDFVETSDFSIFFYAPGSRQICEGDSLYFLQALSVNNVKYTWVFEPGDTSHNEVPYKVYPDSGSFDVTLIAEDSGGCVKTQYNQDYIEVQMYPVAEFFADRTDSTCYPLPVQFSADTNLVYYDTNSYFYTLGDFTAASIFKDPFYNYVRPGSYTVSLVVTTPFGCSDTIVKPNYINISGPYGEMSISPDSLCRSDSAYFQILNTINVSTWGWDLGDGNSRENQSFFWHEYKDSVGSLYPTLFFSDSVGGCAKTFTDTIYLYETVAKFTFDDTSGCVTYNPELANESRNSRDYEWYYGDGTSSFNRDPNKVFKEAGTYLVSLYVEGPQGCLDSVFQEFTAHPLPIVTAEYDTLICLGDSIQLNADGASSYLWSPNEFLSNNIIADPLAYPVSQIDYLVIGTDSNGCENSDAVSIVVQQPIDLEIDDVSVIIGDTITFKVYGGPGVKYKWTPADSLDCDTCPNVFTKMFESQEFVVFATDTNGCFEAENRFFVEVLEEFTLDVPSAFTPNGDGINDKVFVRGWGLKSVETFRIYNQWGELVFETNDITVGWDGTYEGSLQEVGTFVYYVEAETYDERVLTKKGTIDLLR